MVNYGTYDRTGRKICGEITEFQTNDAYIIDSIYNYCNQKHLDDCDEIILITQNKKDFFESQKTLKLYKLKQKFVDTKYNVIGLYCLHQLHEYINFKFDIETTKEIEKKYKQFNNDYPEAVFDNDEVSEKFCKIESENNETINGMFEEKAVNAPVYLQDIRKRLLGEIMDILGKCRQTVSWNDRSELKLYQWLENRNEEQIPSSKLSELFIIKDSLKKYLQVHIEMDSEMV